jgi:hypothetical protein
LIPEEDKLVQFGVINTTSPSNKALVTQQKYTAMNEEYLSLMANNTWDLVPLPKGIKLVR